jgi:hypothetical protein
VWTLQHGQVEVREATAPVAVEGKTYPAGSYVVLTQQPFGGYGKALLERQHYPDLFDYPGGPPKRPYDVTAHTLPLLFGVDVVPVLGAAPPTGKPVAAVADPTFVNPVSGKTAKRIAIYRPGATEPMDEGWTRWLFDVSKVPFTTITEKDVAGSLNDRFDVIVVPDGSGGLGDTGPVLDAFVTNGGSILAFNNASNMLISLLQLPVRNALAGVRNNDFYAPGSIFAVEVRREHPIARYFTAPVPAVWFENGPAFEITDPAQATAVATYPVTGNPLLSGWLLGAPKIAGNAALVDVKRGKGHVVLYGFRPQYRGQPNATFPLIWGAVLQ